MTNQNEHLEQRHETVADHLRGMVAREVRREKAEEATVAKGVR
jgi:hypothetical protein